MTNLVSSITLPTLPFPYYFEEDLKHYFICFVSISLCNPQKIRTLLENKTTTSLSHLKKLTELPWWRSGWESACQCRGHGFEPWSGRIPHAAERLGPWATTTEPARLEPVLRNKRGHGSERPAHRNEEWPSLAATGEGPSTETKTQHSNQSINQ